MQIASVTYAPIVQARTEPELVSDKSVALAEGSTLSALQEAEDSSNSGRQSEQKPTDRLASEAENSRSEVQFTDDELQMIRQLESRDREVRAHEQAHKSVGGQYAGAISYTYQRGPDGVNYAIGGEVSISVSPVQGDPQATIEKADTVRRAALAPAEPSAQDRSVAAQATQLKAEALSELNQQQAEEAAARREEDTASQESGETSASSDTNNESGESATGEEQSTVTDISALNTADDAVTSDAVSAPVVADISDGRLSPQSFANLLAADIARKSAMAVFEDINAQLDSPVAAQGANTLDEMA
jgi:hypothetical protein